MTGRRLRYGLIALVFFLAGLVTYLPAGVATGWVADDTPLRFEGVTGTLLHGKAAYVSLPSGGLENLAWDLHPASLLLGRVSADVTADTDLGQISASATRTLLGYNYLSDITGQATLGWIAGRAGYTFVPASGYIALDVPTLDFDDALDVMDIKGRVDITQARYELLNPSVELGRFSADLAPGDDDGLTAKLVDSHGPLAIDGGLEASARGSYDLDVRLRARAGADDRLKRLLGQLGTPDAQGWYPVRERGTL